ncbi:hypothetical protein IKF74_00375 [Candidatus Saccharibacteria bacterium]|nr:hypothetical protein [Candidatus Saccharibacteria bacterium]
MPSKRLKADLSQIKTDEICENTSEKLISITESKARLVYHDYADAPTKSTIFTNLGLAVAFITPVLTSDFRSIWLFSSSTMQAVFAVASIIFVVKAISATIDYLKNGTSLNEENFVRALKGQDSMTIAQQKKERDIELKLAYIEGRKDERYKKPIPTWLRKK